MKNKNIYFALFAMLFFTPALAFADEMFLSSEPDIFTSRQALIADFATFTATKTNLSAISLKFVAVWHEEVGERLYFTLCKQETAPTGFSCDDSSNIVRQETFDVPNMYNEAGEETKLTFNSPILIQPNTKYWISIAPGMGYIHVAIGQNSQWYKLWTDPSFRSDFVSLENGTETEDDAVQDTKGAADKTNFTFAVDFFDKENLPPENVTLVTNDGTVTNRYPLTDQTGDGNYINGEHYAITRTFPVGRYRYHLEANNGAGRFPDAGEFNFASLPTSGYPDILSEYLGMSHYENSEITAPHCIPYGNSREDSCQSGSALFYTPTAPVSISSLQLVYHKMDTETEGVVARICSVSGCAKFVATSSPVIIPAFSYQVQTGKNVTFTFPDAAPLEVGQRYTISTYWLSPIDGRPHVLNLFAPYNDVKKSIILHVLRGGVTAPETKPALTNGIETEDDGIVDGKGVADKTGFTFNILYTGATAPADITLWENDGTATNSYPLALSATTTNDGNFQNGEWYTFTGTFPKGSHGYHFEANGGAARFPETGELQFTTGYDSIVFLPGVAGSRLYEEYIAMDSEHCPTDTGDRYLKRWFPKTDCDNTKLLLNSDGSSKDDIVTKDVVDKAVGVTDIYTSFLNDLAVWKSDGTIADYSAIPYDWRLSLDDLFTKGVKNSDGYIDYKVTPDFDDEPYIMSEFKRMAETSDTGKVTIIGHSNGGLLAKELMRRLKAEDKEILADKVIFVAVPEVGTPDAVVSLLHGSNIGPLNGIISSRPETREIAQNMPTAYNLLPSAEYYTTQTGRTVPIASFDDSLTFANQKRDYGYVLTNYVELTNFLLGTEVRPTPNYYKLNSPAKANEGLLTSAQWKHEELDVWSPASTTKVIEVAGWGIDTLAGLQYKEETTCLQSHAVRTIFTYTEICDVYATSTKLTDVLTINGDETVVSDSAHYLTDKGTENTDKWWVDLPKHNAEETDRSHKNILEIENLRRFIKNQITNSTESLDFISTVKPINSRPTIKYELHSPLSINLYDNQGNHTGISVVGEKEENIPGTYYREIGDTKYVIVPADIATHLVLTGYAEGSFSLDIQKKEGDTILAETSFSAIPSKVGTIVKLDVPANSDIVSPNALSPLQIDFNGDNVTDVSMTAKPNQETVYDVIPPDVSISFDQVNKKLVFSGKDNYSTTTVTTNQNSSMITDEAGNTTELIFSKYKTKAKKIELVISTIKQNGIVVLNTPIPLTYKWNTERKNQTWKTLASYVKTPTEKVETHYRPKKNQTIIMTKPQDLNDDEDDEDDIDMRPTKEKLAGIHVVEFAVENGTIKVGY